MGRIIKLTDADLTYMLEELDLSNSSSVQKRQEIKQALKKLIIFDEENIKENADDFMNLIANNHAGVYYRELYDVVDFLILLLDNSTNNRARYVCILGILNDLSYFELESSKQRDGHIDAYIREKLAMFSDDNFDAILNRFIHS